MPHKTTVKSVILSKLTYWSTRVFPAFHSRINLLNPAKKKHFSFQFFAFFDRYNTNSATASNKDFNSRLFWIGSQTPQLKNSRQSFLRKLSKDLIDLNSDQGIAKQLPVLLLVEFRRQIGPKLLAEEENITAHVFSGVRI